MNLSLRILDSDSDAIQDVGHFAFYGIEISLVFKAQIIDLDNNSEPYYIPLASDVIINLPDAEKTGTIQTNRSVITATLHRCELHRMHSGDASVLISEPSIVRTAYLGNCIRRLEEMPEPGPCPGPVPPPPPPPSPNRSYKAKGTAVYHNSGEQDILTLATTTMKVVNGIWFDLSNATKNATIKLYYKIDGNNYKEFSSNVFNVIADSKGTYINLAGMGITDDFKITYNASSAEGADRNIPYMLMFETKE